jgi:hypothetical protein
MGFARNTLPVMAGFATRVWRATNHCLLYRRKTVITKCLDIRAGLLTGASGTNELWHGRFHSGHGVRALGARIGLAPVDNSSATDAETYLTVGGTDTDKIHQSYVNLGDVADNLGAAEIIYAISSDATITWSLTAVDYARPYSLCIYELGDFQADTADGGVDPRLGQASPLLDSNHQQLHEAQTELWKTNAAHLYSWSRDNAASAPTFASKTTYTNLWDGTTTGGASVTTPHITLETTYHNTVGSTNVPIVFAVRGERTVGSGTCKARLVDDGNNTLCELAAITTNGWYSNTANLTAGTIVAAVEIESASGSTVRIDAVSVYEHE